MIENPNALAGARDMTFRMLGPLEVEGAEGMLRVPPGRQQAVLASLLLEANRIVLTDNLVDILWETRPPNTARTQVQICVSRLRKSLLSAGVDAPILTCPPGYLLRVDESLIDVHAFAHRLADARVLATRGRSAEAAAMLRSAVALWRGTCLSGIPHQALRSRALRLDEDRLNAVETYLGLDLELGRHHQVIGEITRLVHEHPLRERLRGLLMLALYRSGRQAEALASYRSGREQLIEDLGLEPRAVSRSRVLG